MGVPARYFWSSSKNAVCSGRAAFCAAFSADSNRAMVTTVPSGAIAVVAPRNPIASFISSGRRSSSTRRKPAASVVLPSMIWMNIGITPARNLTQSEAGGNGDDAIQTRSRAPATGT